MAFEFFEQLLIILGAALFVAVLFSRLRLPAIIAYLFAGFAIGPHLFAWVDPEGFGLIAEFGVVFLLFALGLEFSLPRMLALKGPVFGLGGAQVLVTTSVFAAAVYFWGASLEAAIVIAGALALSSTAIVTRELASLQQLGARYAELAVAILLFQDLVAVVFLILVPVFGGSGESSIPQALAWAFGKGIVLLAILMGVGKFVLPRVYQEVARTRSEEVFLLTTLVIALLAAWLTHAFALSMALGGFIIGMMLGEGPFRHRIETDVRPFKDVLLGLFFVTIGMNVDLGVVADNSVRIIVFAAVLILISVVVLALIAHTLGESRAVALRVGITLAQAGEFGLALLVLAESHGVVPHDQSSFIIAIAVLSMCVSPLLIRHVDAIANAGLKFLRDPDTTLAVPTATIETKGHVIIGGFGRVGRTIASLLRANDVPYIAIEGDPELVRLSCLEGENVIFGDCSDEKLLAHCHIDEARLAILTFRSSEDAKHSISRIRELGIDTPIIVRCYENGDFEELISLGANHVVPEMLESSLIIGGQVLSFLGFADTEINRQLSAFRDPLNERGIIL